MTAQSSITSVSGDIEVAAHPLDRRSWGSICGRFFSTLVEPGASPAPPGVRLPCGGIRLTKTEEQEDHHQPPRQIHLSRTEICLKKWSHPSQEKAWASDGPSSSQSCPRAAGGATGAGVLFLPYSADQIATLRSAIATWLRLAIFEAMNGPEGDQRLWFVIDELDALGAIDGLKDALARVRKFGGRCVLGFQSIGQVSATYGRGESQRSWKTAATR